MGDLDRYHRQMLLKGIGEPGQRKLLGSRVLIVGCGALGTMIADSLARAGVGTLIIVDRDTVELTNLQRQVLFDEADAATTMPKAPAAAARIARINSGITVQALADDFNHRNAERYLGDADVIVDRDTVELTNLQRQVLFDEEDAATTMPKAPAAAARIARINSGITVQALADDFNHRNAERYLGDADVILDGLDNFETRYLVNDLAVRHGVPYLYGGAVGTGGMAMAILPHPERRLAGKARSRVRYSAEESTPCLRCVFPEPPPPGVTPTCDTAGVLGAAVAVIAAHQAAAAIKLLTGNVAAVDRSLLSIDVWENATRRFDVAEARRAGHCPCCVEGRFEFLEGAAGSAATALCGRNAVQITPAQRHAGGLDLEDLARRLAAHGTFNHNGFLLHGQFTPSDGRAPFELTLFPDGRAIIKGTSEIETAKSLYARYVGS